MGWIIDDILKKTRMRSYGHHIYLKNYIGDSEFWISEKIYPKTPSPHKAICRAASKTDSKSDAVVLKIVNIGSENDQKVKESIEKEFDEVNKIGHINVLSYEDKFYTDKSENEIVFSMRPMNYTLRQRLEEKTALNMKDKIQYAVQLCDGLAAIHAKGFFHGDLKFDNLFIYKDPGDQDVLKIADFGYASYGTKNWQHPGLVRSHQDGIPLKELNKQHRQDWDIYAMALIIARMIVNDDTTRGKTETWFIDPGAEKFIDQMTYLREKLAVTGGDENLAGVLERVLTHDNHKPGGVGDFIEMAGWKTSVSQEKKRESTALLRFFGGRKEGNALPRWLYCAFFILAFSAGISFIYGTCFFYDVRWELVDGKFNVNLLIKTVILLAFFSGALTGGLRLADKLIQRKTYDVVISSGASILLVILTGICLFPKLTGKPQMNNLLYNNEFVEYAKKTVLRDNLTDINKRLVDKKYFKLLCLIEMFPKRNDNAYERKFLQMYPLLEYALKKQAEAGTLSKEAAGKWDLLNIKRIGRIFSRQQKQAAEEGFITGIDDDYKKFFMGESIHLVPEGARTINDIRVLYHDELSQEGHRPYPWTEKYTCALINHINQKGHRISLDCRDIPAGNNPGKKNKKIPALERNITHLSYEKQMKLAFQCIEEHKYQLAERIFLHIANYAENLQLQRKAAYLRISLMINYIEDFEQVIKASKSFIKKFSEVRQKSMVYLWIGQSYLKLAKPEKAVAFLKEGRDKFPYSEAAEDMTYFIEKAEQEIN